LFVSASLSPCARHVHSSTLFFVSLLSHDTDTADLHPHFQPACHFIRTALDAGHAALVHCQQGISRSAAIATAFLIRQHGLSLRDAYVRVKSSRPTVKVNANFLKQLIRWEKECRESEENERKTRAERSETFGEVKEKGKETAAKDKRKRVQVEGLAEEGKETKEVHADGDEREKEKQVQETKQKLAADTAKQSTEGEAAAATDSSSEQPSVAERERDGSSKRQKVAAVEPAVAEQSPLVSSTARQTEIVGAAGKS